MSERLLTRANANLADHRRRPEPPTRAGRSVEAADFGPAPGDPRMLARVPDRLPGLAPLRLYSFRLLAALQHDPHL